jgi:hypothetical protein
MAKIQNEANSDLPGIQTTHADPLVTEYDLDGWMVGHMNLSTVANIYGVPASEVAKTAKILLKNPQAKIAFGKKSVVQLSKHHHQAVILDKWKFSEKVQKKSAAKSRIPPAK